MHFNVWLADVAKYRGMTFEEAELLAHGRVWTGEQAAENGLIDEVGGLMQAVNIAKRVKNISERQERDFFYDYSFMGEKVLVMLNKSLDSFINHDIELAWTVISLDDDVDELRNEVYDLIKNEIMKNPEQVGYLINLLLISRHLERIADHSTNIAEGIIYLVDGEIIRHT